MPDLGAAAERLASSTSRGGFLARVSRTLALAVGGGTIGEGSVDGMECDEFGNVWVTGPGGERWEVYTVLADGDDGNDRLYGGAGDDFQRAPLSQFTKDRK